VVISLLTIQYKSFIENVEADKSRDCDYSYIDVYYRLLQF